VQNFISIGQGVTAGRGPKIACSHRKAESSIILHCTTVHAVIGADTETVEGMTVERAGTATVGMKGVESCLKPCGLAITVVLRAACG
jgi:hypothetical protein